eukprot:8394486-Ditylum_brightwellii.AAC.1
MDMWIQKRSSLTITLLKGNRYGRNSSFNNITLQKQEEAQQQMPTNIFVEYTTGSQDTILESNVWQDSPQGVPEKHTANKYSKGYSR